MSELLHKNLFITYQYHLISKMLLKKYKPLIFFIRHWICKTYEKARKNLRACIILWYCEIALQIENSALKLIAFTIDSRIPTPPAAMEAGLSAFNTELLSD